MPRDRRQITLCFVGSMLGDEIGFPPSQAEILGQLFIRSGYSVNLVSRRKNRLARLANMVTYLISQHSRIDLALIQIYSGAAFGLATAAALTAAWLRLPIIMALHGGNLPKFSRQYPTWVGKVLGYADALICPSAYLAAELPRDALRLKKDVRIIPNVVELAGYPFRCRLTPEPNLLWMRTFQEAYHPEMAAEVLHRLKLFYPQARLTMAGQDQGCLDSTRKVIAAYGLEDSFRYAGAIDMAGKQREFAAHDIFLNTNHIDNMPVSLIEAAAFGLPIVSTRVGGIPYQFVHEQSALLVEDNDAAGMANAIRRLIDEPRLAGRLSTNARQIAEACDWPQVRAQWEDVFRQVLRQ